MQDLNDHTVDRILEDPEVVEHIRQLKEEYGSVSLEFIYKFGLGRFHLHLFWFIF